MIFVYFFMGHEGTIESQYTTNKRVLPVMLDNEMRDAFARSEKYLTDQSNIIPDLNQKQQIHEIINQATPRQIECVLDMLTRTIKTD